MDEQGLGESPASEHNLSPEPSSEKKKSKKRNPFKRLAGLSSSFKKHSSKAGLKHQFSDGRCSGDDLQPLRESPGTTRRMLREAKAKSLDFGLDEPDLSRETRSQSADGVEHLGMNGDDDEMMSREVSPTLLDADAQRVEDKRAESEDHTSIDGGDRHSRAQTPQIRVTAPEAETTEAKNVQLPVPGMKYKLLIHLISGTDLAIRDKSGTSDPYVKFRIGNRRSKSNTIFKDLNPVWNELFVMKVDNVSDQMKVKVYDYDYALTDDFMGYAFVDLSNLALGESHVQTIYLEDEESEDENLGFLTLRLKLASRTHEFDLDEEQNVSIVERSPTPVERPAKASQVTHKSHCTIRRCRSKGSMRKANSLDHAAVKRAKSQLWKNVLNVVLLNGKSLPAMDDNGFSDPYCKFRLGAEKFKTKVCSKSLNPEWKEQFDLHVYEDQSHILEIEVWDRDYGSRDDFIGRCSIDLDDLSFEETHRKTLELKDCESGEITILLTVSGGTGHGEEIDGKTDGSNKSKRPRKYSVWHTLRNIDDVGLLKVKVIKAVGIPATDFFLGTSNPFIVLELDNCRVRTETVYKTIEPGWEKEFTLDVKDIHSLLEVTLFDEDKHRNEFLGRLVIPLLSITPGERRWFQLKNRNLHSRVKGDIQLELDLVYNPIRAAIRTFNPKEVKYLSEEEKFKYQVLVKNVQRVANLIRTIFAFWQWIQSLFEWTSKSRSVAAFIVFLVVTWHFEWWMTPVFLVGIFFFQYIAVSSKSKHAVITTGCLGSTARRASPTADGVDSEETSDDEDEPKSKEGKLSLVKKYRAVMDVCQTVQNVLDTIASLGERVKNSFNWTVPFLSWLAIVVLIVAGGILYLIPLRYLILAWGINKFTKRLRKPNFIPNNELLDYLSRVPSDDELLQWCETKPGSAVKKIKKK
ncbi:multiple C2 and transmembrane domain-containing protein 1-like isoform X2 [Corticium candelabrum]|uniref:multiple C2 and transmembrane domain-containing protein 1-like isoform X2 n=1 Tax=Corticium candelabrum TaxID=121492 RepID=UPI002E260522|nr:multiple C2 and transmembrane domain-containing protein 1-like isoform X2 [Corticium candelabrum]XP_062516684.1 multiple C2 and transmembrane domain-containing protein 1-like isoform X2 [Corticium candelabrum]